MRAIQYGLVLGVGFALAAAVPCVRADEEKVPLDKVPKVVTDAVKKRFPDAELKSAETEKEDGKTVYEITIKNKGQAIEVTLTPEGVITGMEAQIDAKELPKAVAEALDKKYPKATFKMVEEVTKVTDGKEILESYEVLLVAGEKTVEVVITPEGKITKEEDKTKKKD